MGSAPGDGPQQQEYVFNLVRVVMPASRQLGYLSPTVFESTPKRAVRETSDPMGYAR